MSSKVSAGCRVCGNLYYHTIDCLHWIKSYEHATPVTEEQREFVPTKKPTKLVQDFHREDEERVNGYE